MFSLVPQNREITADDHSLWERSPESVQSLKDGAARTTSGLADRYTWRTRSLRLVTDGAGRIWKLAFASGVGNSTPDQIDPMHGYRIDETRGKLPIQFRERGFWRDFDSLLPDDSRLAPLVIEHATALTMFTNRERFPRSVMVLGQANNKAKIEYWRMERFALPGALAGVRNIRTEIRQLLTAAEEVQKMLWFSCSSFARDLLSRGDRKPVAKDVSGFVEQMPAISWYWSTLEACFHEILHDYSEDRDSYDIRCQWLKSLRDTLRASWEQHSSSASMGDAWVIRALVRAEGPVRRKISELNEEITKLERGEGDA